MRKPPDIDVVQLVRDGHGRFEWHWITSIRNGLMLRVAVMRDAMKFDGLPRLDWYRRYRDDDGSRFDGVRLPASAHELQQIADLVGGWLLTPRIVDLIWLQAKVKFNAIVNSGPPRFDIVAEMDITDVHELIEAEAFGHGDDNQKLVSCVGKYWVLISDLSRKGMTEGDWTACNYGWCSNEGSGPGLTAGVRCWQRPGYRHNKNQIDPSQTIRLMWPTAELSLDEGESWQEVSMQEVATTPKLAPLITHDGKPLSYLRQNGVEPLPPCGQVVLPPVTITAEPGAVS